MKRKPSSFTLLMAALVASSPALRAQAPEPSPTPAPLLSEATAPRRARAVSPEVAASIAAAMPKYNPPPKPAEKKIEEVQLDLRETDKPKNGIVRLPNYVVRDRQAPILRERDVYTQKGLGEVASKRYITDADKALNRFQIPLFSPISVQGSGSATTDRALLMYSEDERLKNLAELKDDAGLVSTRDKAAGAYVKREALQTYRRTDDFGWQNNNK